MRLTDQLTTDASGNTTVQDTQSGVARTSRIKSEDLFQQQHEVEIDHQGRIYRLRRTQLNKLILTA